MSRRVTIMIEDDLDKKIREKQAKKIQTTAASYSYSKCINDELRKYL